MESIGGGGMKKYIGTKIIDAEPRQGADGREGYKVVYKDGYSSWSPKDVFEEAYVPIDEIANKLTAEGLEAKIVKTELMAVAGTTTTICVLILENGFVVTGTSACIDKAVYQEEIGASIAYEDAINKLWELEGYLLAQRRFEAGLTKE